MATNDTRSIVTSVIEPIDLLICPVMAASRRDFLQHSPAMRRNCRYAQTFPRKKSARSSLGGRHALCLKDISRTGCSFDSPRRSSIVPKNLNSHLNREPCEALEIGALCRRCFTAVISVPFTSGLCVRIERGVTVECLKCGHVGFLSPKVLSRVGLTPSTPIVAFVKRLRCRRCGSQSVLATRKAPPQKAS
jgi:hypothetical protein